LAQVVRQYRHSSKARSRGIQSHPVPDSSSDYIPWSSQRDVASDNQDPLRIECRWLSGTNRWSGTRSHSHEDSESRHRACKALKGLFWV